MSQKVHMAGRNLYLGQEMECSPLIGQGPYVLSVGSIQMAGQSWITRSISLRTSHTKLNINSAHPITRRQSVRRQYHFAEAYSMGHTQSESLLVPRPGQTECWPFGVC